MTNDGLQIILYGAATFGLSFFAIPYLNLVRKFPGRPIHGRK